VNSPTDIRSGLFELFDTQPDTAVQPLEYQRLLGFPRAHVLEGRSRELAEWAAAWYSENGQPWIHARQVGGIEVKDKGIQINSTSFTSDQLVSQLRQTRAHDVVLAAVSAGIECEAKARELWNEGKPDEYFFMEIYGSAVVEHLVAQTSGRLCAWADSQGLAVLPHYSPGYSGWDVSEQVQLWQAIRQEATEAESPATSRSAEHCLARGSQPSHLPNSTQCSNPKVPGFKMRDSARSILPLEVLPSGMLRPKKSLLAVFGLTRHTERVRARLVPCESCSLVSCQYRRVPYAHFRPQIEDMRRLQGMDESASDTGSGDMPALIEDAAYSTNRKALRKWARERLELQTLADQSTEARFRYEGTTCSNMGAPLEFHYKVIIGPPGNGSRITSAECAPAHHDRGHTLMCEYLKDPTSLMGSIANERPLLGHPLNDVLTWDAPRNPSGCYCDAERRAHKWRLVFEVIHFALSERQRADSTSPTKT